MKRILFIVLILVAAGGLVGIYLFNKKPADTRDEKVAYEITSVQLMKEFSTDEETATKKYADKILLVSGALSDINIGSATLFIDANDPVASITCSFYSDEAPRLQNLKKGDMVRVKGKCTGKLIDVVLNNCSLNLPN